VEASSAKKVEVRLYDRLFNVEAPEGIEDINPDSLKIIKDALIEPAVITEKPDERFQFEREGYFYADPVDYRDDAPVFNKIVSLKDSWAKKKKTEQKPKQESKPQPKKKRQVDGEVAPMSREEQARYETYTGTMKLNGTVAEMLARDAKLSAFFEEALRTYNAPLTMANLVANEVARELKHQDAGTLKFTPEQVAALVKMIDEGTISTKIAKEVFDVMSREGTDPVVYVEEKGLKQISDPAVILPVIEDVIAKNPENVQKYREGNNKLFGFFVGQVLKATGGKADPKVVNTLVKQQLEQ
jgi:glutaminyl-tRNA synthetase